MNDVSIIENEFTKIKDTYTPWANLDPKDRDTTTETTIRNALKAIEKSLDAIRSNQLSNMKHDQEADDINGIDYKQKTLVHEGFYLKPSEISHEPVH